MCYIVFTIILKSAAPLMGAPLMIQAHITTIPTTGMTLYIFEMFSLTSYTHYIPPFCYGLISWTNNFCIPFISILPISCPKSLDSHDFIKILRSPSEVEKVF